MGIIMDEMIRIIIANAFAVWCVSLSNHTKEGRALHEVLSNPIVGDMVLEITRAIRTKDPAGLGRLIAIKQEIVNPWLGAGPAPVVVTYDIDTIAGERVSWFNCKLIRVIEEPVDFIKEAEARGLLLERL